MSSKPKPPIKPVVPPKTKPMLRPEPVRSTAATPAQSAASDVADDLQVETPQTPTPSVAETTPEFASLFDFETSTEDFTLHSLLEWRQLPPQRVTLTPQAAQGQYAMQAMSPIDAWVGRDRAESVDFHVFKRITFSMHSALGVAGRMAIKSGSQYDWCELQPSAVANSNGFIRYELVLQTNDRDCKLLDLEDVRGLHWFVQAGDTVVLDDVKLR